MLVEYRAVDFLGGMLAKATGAASVTKVLSQNQGFKPILFCDGPHMLGPVLILERVIHDNDKPFAPRKAGNSEFVCSDCGGDISEVDRVCPHCGALIEGESQE